MSVRLGLSAFLITAASVLAQHHPMKPPVEKPVSLYKGMGAWRHPIATSNAEAQTYFDQGLALLYGFNRYEALRSFRKASELDPDAAMPGGAWPWLPGPYVNMDAEPDDRSQGRLRGHRVRPQAARLPRRVSARTSRPPPPAVPSTKPQTYIDAMKALTERYPDDLDAATLYAESLMVPVRWQWYGTRWQTRRRYAGSRAGPGVRISAAGPSIRAPITTTSTPSNPPPLRSAPCPAPSASWA